jgi:hypothetical protein
VWDVLLLDGLDVLFRVALGVLKCHEAELLRCDSIPAVYVALESLPTRMWQPDKLLQVGPFFRLRRCIWDYNAAASLKPFCSSNSSYDRRSFTLILKRKAMRTSLRYWP